jgi:nitrate reductase NapD
MNISSVIVIPHPERVATVSSALGELPGVEVAIVSPEGKIIVTIETDGDAETVRAYEIISQLDGVMSASMVYHQQENEPEVEVTVAA